MGGTRFVGKPLVARLKAQGHELTLLTRGKNSVPDGVEHLKGDRSTDEGMASLKGRSFDVIVDSSGRKLEDSRRVLAITGAPSHRFVYVSSAGVYAESAQWPLSEDAATDPQSRHAGKAETEHWLRAEGVPFTSFRPTYIYGPGNYNPIERWFFDRIVNDRPIPLPGDGSTITQLGHVDDLAEAMAPGMPTNIIGIRPGEKLHETMIPADDSRSTYDVGDRYIVESDLDLPIPTVAERFGDKATIVPNEFAYTSDANEEWMDVETLRNDIANKHMANLLKNDVPN